MLFEPGSATTPSAPLIGARASDAVSAAPVDASRARDYLEPPLAKLNAGFVLARRALQNGYHHFDALAAIPPAVSLHRRRAFDALPSIVSSAAPSPCSIDSASASSAVR